MRTINCKLFFGSFLLQFECCMVLTVIKKIRNSMLCVTGFEQKVKHRSLNFHYHQEAVASDLLCCHPTWPFGLWACRQFVPSGRGFRFPFFLVMQPA